MVRFSSLHPWLLCLIALAPLGGGCMMLTHGTHQDIRLQSELPDTDIQLDGQSCRAPCTVNVRRQWPAYTVRATQNDRVVAEGPVYRRDRYGHCEDWKGWNLMLSDMPDMILLVPFIVNFSMGLTEYHPEAVVIDAHGYRVEDACFETSYRGGPRPIVPPRE